MGNKTKELGSITKFASVNKNNNVTDNNTDNNTDNKKDNVTDNVIDNNNDNVVVEVVVDENNNINIDDYISVADPKYMVGIYFDKHVAKVLRKLTKGKKGSQSKLVNDTMKKLFQDNGYL